MDYIIYGQVEKEYENAFRLGRYSCLGQINPWDSRVIWRIDNLQQVVCDYPAGWSIASPAFKFRSKVRPQRLEFYPNGKIYESHKSDHCSLYLWTGAGAPATCLLQVGNT